MDKKTRPPPKYGVSVAGKYITDQPNAMGGDYESAYHSPHKVKKMNCNGDCFNCPFEDCIADDDSFLEESELLDKKILAERRQNEIDSITTLETEVILTKKKGRPRKPDETKELRYLRKKIQNRERYRRNRDRLLAQAKEYYARNIQNAEFREKLRQRDREKYLRRKEKMNERTNEPI